MRAFSYAFSGVAHAWRSQRNFRIQVALGIVAFAVCAALHVPAGGFATLALAIALVLALEVLNTALEALVDLASPQLHPLAKAAKDASAGAVLLAATGSVAVGAFLAWQALSSR
ncbi:MAG: diacylglycerol kinase family protein [Vulcanimicrobiaceae bacterium]